MDWTDWPIACWSLSTLIALWLQRWTEAGSCACFALYMLLDRMGPPAGGGPPKYVFLALGAGLIGYQAARRYARYKKGEPMIRPKSR